MSHYVSNASKIVPFRIKRLTAEIEVIKLVHERYGYLKERYAHLVEEPE